MHNMALKRPEYFLPTEVPWMLIQSSTSLLLGSTVQLKKNLWPLFMDGVQLLQG